MPKAAVLIYADTSFLMAVAFNLIWNHSSRGNRLLDTSLDPRLFERVHQRYRFGPLIYAACFALGFVSVPATLCVLGALALLYALPYNDGIHAVEARIHRLTGKSPRR